MPNGTGRVRVVNNYAATTCDHDIWRLWAAATYAGTTTGTTTICEWDNAVTNTATTVWRNWVIYADTIGAEAVLAVARETRVVSEEERARWRKREKELEAAAAEARAQRKLADERAEALLRSLLTPQQREELARNNRFHLHVGDRRYRVDRGQHGNVKLVDAKDQVIESYCIQPAGGLPNADAMAAQLLTLETDEAEFLRVANVSNRDGRLIRRGMQA